MATSNSSTLALSGSLATQMMKKRVKTDTLSIYKHKIDKMIEWYKLHIPEALTGEPGAEELVIPTEKDHVLKFFAAMSIKDETVFDVDEADGTEMLDPNDPDLVLKAVSTMGGYRSALVHAHKAKSMKLNAELDIDLQSFMQGLKRSVADLKQRGTSSMPVCYDYDRSILKII